MKRLAGLDVIRTIAIFSVVCVHFFLNTKYYDNPLNSINMYIQTFLLLACLICVPLFLLLSGFLQCHKKLSLSYFKGIIPIIGIYLLYSVVSIIVRVFFVHERYSFLHWIAEIFSFRADSYSWYINMYVGLFLLMPFINIILNNLKSVIEYRMLLIVLMFIIALPQFLNNIITIFPSWWAGFYPIFYYCLGAYIKEYPLKINKAIAGILFFIIVLIETIITVLYSKGNPSMLSWDYGSILIMICAVLIFIIFYDVDIKSRIVKSFFKWISILSLDTYLSSFVTDTFVYKYVMESVFITQDQILFYMLFIVLMTFVSAAIISLCRYMITELVKMLTHQMQKPKIISNDVSQ